MAERYRAAGRFEKGRILDELCATTGWHRKHAVRVLRATAQLVSEPKPRQRRYGAAIKDAIVAFWEASDRVCGKRLKPMIPVLLPALVMHGRLTPTREERAKLLSVSAATIDRMLVEVSPTHGTQEGTAWNGHFDCSCYHPLFVFNQFGHLERCKLRPGKVHSADGWEEVLKPVVS